MWKQQKEAAFHGEVINQFYCWCTFNICFRTTTRPDVIKIDLYDADPDMACSAKVKISTITKERVRNIAVVIAEDIHTRQTLRCDVIVDVIQSLGIVTKTRELFMNEAPEGFYITAYDSQGRFPIRIFSRVASFILSIRVPFACSHSRNLK